MIDQHFCNEFVVDEDDDDNTPISPLAASAGMSNSHAVNEPPQSVPHSLHEPMPSNPSGLCYLHL